MRIEGDPAIGEDHIFAAKWSLHDKYNPSLAKLDHQNESMAVLTAIYEAMTFVAMHSSKKKYYSWWWNIETMPQLLAKYILEYGAKPYEKISGKIKDSKEDEEYKEWSHRVAFF